MIKLVSILLLAGFLISCDREERQFRVAPPYASRSNSIVMSDNQAGVAIARPSSSNPYEHNAYAISEGQRLFDQMNCSGCHAHGGGAIGPPLMDDKWIYGSDPLNIYATIVQGRPNGMPSFRGKLDDQQVWQLVAYVRTLGTLTRRDAMSSRNDHMMTTPEFQMQTESHPKQTDARNAQ
jgi:cytochrome c oxidase cbb3-type subunit 3